MLLSLEVLRRFCELDGRYIDVDAGSACVMDYPANMLSLCCTAHTKFDAFGLCFVYTQVRVPLRVRVRVRLPALPAPSPVLRVCLVP